MVASGVAVSAFILAVVVLIGGSVYELMMLKVDEEKTKRMSSDRK